MIAIALVFSPTLGPDGVWQVWDRSAHFSDSTPGIVLRICFNSSKRLGERAARKRIIEIVHGRSPEQFVVFREDRWVVDLAALRANFEFLSNQDWLTGFVSIEPEHDEQDDEFAGKPRYKQSMHVTISPETIKVAGDRARREDDLQDETRRQVVDSLWVVECEEHITQGTAFSLADSRIVTCHHVVCNCTKNNGQCASLVAFRYTHPFDRFPVRVIKADATIDLALIDLGSRFNAGLVEGDPNVIQQMDRVWVTGFPNYRKGDSAFVSPGVITAFRPIAGIRRLLTDAKIVGGNSGGPAVTSDGRVIGIAVTGTDCQENAHKTENHGLIPVDALRFLR